MSSVLTNLLSSLVQCFPTLTDFGEIVTQDWGLSSDDCVGPQPRTRFSRTRGGADALGRAKGTCQTVMMVE